MKHPLDQDKFASELCKARLVIGQPGVERGNTYEAERAVHEVVFACVERRDSLKAEIEFRDANNSYFFAIEDFRTAKKLLHRHILGQGVCIAEHVGWLCGTAHEGKKDECKQEPCHAKANADISGGGTPSA